MRIRIRGPSGQATVNLESDATVETLRQKIASETSLPVFDVKYGYPPKSLSLDQYSPAQLLEDLEVKLNGEQLIVSRSESVPAQQEPVLPSGAQLPTTIPQSNSQSSRLHASIAAPPTKSEPPLHEPTTGSNLPTGGDAEDPPEVSIPDLGGTLVLRIMPDDNSCLFRAISSAVMSDMDAVTEMRSAVAQTIQSDPTTFNKAVLDNKNPDTYCQWIQSPDSWGGQVELMILSQYFNVEICSIDVQSLRVDKYNEGADRACIVVYSGIHYDTIALSLVGMSPEDDVKQFESPIKEEILPKAIELCQMLQQKHYYTDTAAFNVRCNDCGAVLVGERGATDHAASTGHYNFGEYT